VRCPLAPQALCIEAKAPTILHSAGSPLSPTTAARVAILAGVCAALHVVKLPPALQALQTALGISLLQAGFLLSLVQLAGMTAGVAFGALADSLGARRSMLLGLWILAAASAAGGAAQSVGVMLLLRAVEGVGFLLVVLPAPALVRALLPPAERGPALAVWSAYMPTAATLALLCGPWVLQALGWRAWWWLLALLTAGTAWVLAAVVPVEPVEPVDTARSTSSLAITTRSRLQQTLAAPGPWLVALCFCVYAGQWMAVIGFLPTLYAQAGVPAAWVGLLTALAAAVNIVGNLGAGRLLQGHRSPVLLLAAGYLAMAACSFAIFWGMAPAGALGAAQGPAGLAESAAFPSLQFVGRYGAVILFSALGGLIPGTLFPLSARVAPSERTVSTTVGWMQQGSALGQFTVPPLLAWVATQAGGWQWSWVVMWVACTAGLGAAYALSRTTARAVGA
jgi:MFS transporter, CP family, cyanate transporter